MSTRTIRTLAACCLLISSEILAQGSAGTDGGEEPRYLIDSPTAGMLRSGTLAVDVDFFQNGGVLLGLNYGLLSRLSLGISYGGSNLIGDDTAIFNPVPGVNVKLRPFEESNSFPAIVLGFDSQKTIGPAISAVLEYNSGGGEATRGRGYLNLGLRWSLGSGFTLGFDLKDLARNDNKVTIGNRSVKIEFLKPL
jgi:hypothetical protein